MKRRLRGWIALLGVLSVLAAVWAQAAGSPRIVEINMAEENLLAFVRDPGEVSSVAAMVGKYASDSVTSQTLLESNLAMKTLILVDNSLSIPQASRDATKSVLTELVAARKNNEYFAVGTISEDVVVLQDFTDDYTQLKTAIDNMQYQNQETYLTDALYDYLSLNPFGASQDAFDRILVVSDGVDNKSLGYTKDELLGLLKADPLPIYTIGVPNGTTGNEEELENMFSIARATGGETKLLSEVESGVALAAIMETDWSNLAVTASLPEAAQDGSLQTLTLTLKGANGDTSVSLDQIRMPLREAVEPEPEPEPEPTPAPAPVENTVIIREEADNTLMIIILAILGVLIVGGIVTGVILAVRAKKKKDEFDTLTKKREEQMRKEEEYENGATAFVGAETEGDDEGTLGVWEDEKVSTITLTDIHAVEKCFQKPITKSLVIGLAKTSDICINYDKSVSRMHCEIIKEGDSYFIINHSQVNGTTVNGNKVVSKTPLYDGCIIKMGRVEMRVEIN